MLALLGSLEFDVTPPLVCQQSDQEQNIFVNLKHFDMKDLYVFVETLIM